MRIIHICQRDDPSEGGASRVAFHLVKELINLGEDVHILFVYGKKGWFGSHLGSNAHYLGLKNSMDVIIKGYKLIVFIFKYKPIIIHHHEGLIWTYILTSFFKVKTVTHAHVAGGIRSFGYRTKLANFLQRKFTDRLICISEHTKDSWINEGYKLEDTSLLPNGVDFNLFQPATNKEQYEFRQKLGLPLNAFVLGYIGRLHNIMKGTEDFIHVIARLPHNYYGLIAGTGQDEDKLKKLAFDLGIQNRVIFRGAVSDTSEIYKTIDYFVFTSFFEHFGLVVLEAMASNLPIFAFPCKGGVNDFLNENTGFILKDRDPEKMANMIKNVDKEHIYALVKKNRLILTQKYNWNSITTQLLKIYTTL